MLEHGGRLLRAVQRYAIAREQWLDLSSGIAPWPFALPPIATDAWARLPETEDGLEQAARAYYQVDHLLAVAGSQAAIQALPHLRAPGKVGVLSPCYAEHAHAWQRAGHALVELDEAQTEEALDSLDVLVVVNPSNPTGCLLSAQRLLDWHARLSRRGAWLVVDEAFMDMTPQHSIVGAARQPGLIVLRSFGKFFGLAGVRLGFVVAQVSLLQRLAEWLGPWAISGPTRVVAQACLLDTDAHEVQKCRCATASERLARVLDNAGLTPAGGCDLFQYVVTERAARLHDFLAQRGILVRLFEQPSAIRLGLPTSEEDWLRLGQALAIYQKDSA